MQIINTLINYEDEDPIPPNEEEEDYEYGNDG